MQKVGKINIKRFLAPPVLRDNRETTFEGGEGVCEKARDTSRDKKARNLGSTRDGARIGNSGSNEPILLPSARQLFENSIEIIDVREGIGSNEGIGVDRNKSQTLLEKLSRATLILPTSPAYKKSVADGEVYRLSHYSEKGCFAAIINARDGKKFEIFAGVWENCFI